MTLHRPKSDGVAPGVDDTILEREHEIAGAFEQHVTGLLERVVGPGHAEVRVHVALDPASRERTEEHYEPTKTALRSEQRVQENSNGEGASVAGVPGSQSNLPDGDGDSEESEPESGGASRLSWTRNWEVDKVTEKTSVPAGKIARLTVAVLVDGVERDLAGKKIWQPREKQELDRFAELIKGAIGFDEARGDAIQVESAEFHQAKELPAFTDRPEPVYRNRWFLPVVAAAAAAALLATVVLVRRRKTPAVTLEALPGAPGHHRHPGGRRTARAASGVEPRAVDGGPRRSHRIGSTRSRHRCGDPARMAQCAFGASRRSGTVLARPPVLELTGCRPTPAQPWSAGD